MTDLPAQQREVDICNNGLRAEWYGRKIVLANWRGGERRETKQLLELPESAGDLMRAAAFYFAQQIAHAINSGLPYDKALKMLSSAEHIASKVDIAGTDLLQPLGLIVAHYPVIQYVFAVDQSDQFVVVHPDIGCATMREDMMTHYIVTARGGPLSDEFE